MKHALITGGGSGIGRAIAQRLAADGYAISILGRNLTRLQKAQEVITSAQIFVGDVTSELSVGEALKQVIVQAGPVDIVINNAGLVRTAPFGRQSPEDWNLMLQTNVMGAVNITKPLLEEMKRRNWGRIVNIASTASLKGYAYTTAYTASKHALLGFTRALALELATTGITVNAVCPGYADTDIISEAVASLVAKTGRSSEEARATFTRANPQGRLIAPTEVAAAVAWLVSEDAASVTGQATIISGGEIT